MACLVITAVAVPRAVLGPAARRALVGAHLPGPASDPRAVAARGHRVTGRIVLAVAALTLAPLPVSTLRATIFTTTI